MVTLLPGRLVSIMTASAGGHGPPSERDGGVARRDVAKGRINRAESQPI